jgi:hypothetical protein
MILKKYLTEVSFKDGSSEFKTYRRYTRTIEITETSTSLVLDLERKEISDGSFEVSIKGKYDIPVYFKQVSDTEDHIYEVYVKSGNNLIKGDVLEVSFVALNEAISDLYSVDYENGLLYLATPPNIRLDVDYDAYNVLVKGARGIQLEPEDYTVTDTETNILNYKNNTDYNIVYSLKTEEESTYSTPIINDIGINYINTSEEESL